MEPSIGVVVDLNQSMDHQYRISSSISGLLAVAVTSKWFLAVYFSGSGAKICSFSI